MAEEYLFVDNDDPIAYLRAPNLDDILERIAAHHWLQDRSNVLMAIAKQLPVHSNIWGFECLYNAIFRGSYLHLDSIGIDTHQVKSVLNRSDLSLLNTTHLEQVQSWYHAVVQVTSNEG